METPVLRGAAARALKVSLLFCAYVATARLGLLVDPVGGFATLLWPPSGIALATLMLYGYELWPGIFLGAFCANKWVGAPTLAALGIALGNTLEAVAGVYLLRRFGVFRNSMDRLRDVLALIGAAAIVSTMIGASLGVLSLSWGGVLAPSTRVSAWVAWWVGDMLGDLLVAPLVLSWVSNPVRSSLRSSRVLEAGMMWLLLTLGAGSVFFDLLTPFGLKPASISYLVFPGLIWAALRFGQRGSSLAVLYVAAIAAGGTALGWGPFLGGAPHQRLLFLQLFMGVVSAVVLIVAAITCEFEQALRMREDFMAIVTHDLQTPLSSILMAADLGLRASEEGAERGRDLFVRVRRSANQMRSLIGNVLATGKIEAGGLTLNLRPEEVGVLVTEACEGFASLVTVKAIRLRTDLESGLGSVLCDRDSVLRVFSNLIGNALKFTPNEGTITVGARKEGRCVRFFVSDNGPGISTEELPHIFDRYWQARKTARTGAGLGLFITKAIVESHGGHLWVESTPGAGSMFHFTLKLS